MSKGAAKTAVLVLLAMPVGALGQDAQPARIVVRYADSVDACVHCMLQQKRPLASITGRTSLDEKHAELGVRSARPLFGDRAHGGRNRSATNAARLAQVRDRFPNRAAREAKNVEAPDLAQVYVLELPEGTDVAAAAAKLAADPDVVYAEPDLIRRVEFVPDDPFFSSSGTWGYPYPDLWGLHITDAATAWEQSNGTGITVAVVDTGVDGTHPDLAANMWVNAGEIAGNGIDDDGNGFIDDVRGWDFNGNDNDPSDVFGHGTHVAGTIAAVGDNGIGVVGMAWGSRIMSVQTFNSSGSGTSSVLAEGIVYAAENGADVINCSFGGAGSTQVMVDAVNTALALGAVVVAAAGNNSADAEFFEPANIPGVITVSATDPFDARASFSNYGDVVSVGAPGVDILSLLAPGLALGPVIANQYMRISGTSMATPHVAGTVALLLADQPGLDADEVRWHLEVNADQPEFPGYEGELWNPYFGYGRINTGRVFDPVPVTARALPRRVERHAFAGTGAALPDLDLSFTTHATVPWSLSTPPWISPTVSSGMGPAQIGLSFDTAGQLPGQSLTADIAAAGAAIAASEPMRTTLHLHRDDRVGGELALGEDAIQAFPDYAEAPPVRVASNGQTALVLWHHAFVGTMGAFIDADGTVRNVFNLNNISTRQNFAVATDGNDFLVVWIQYADIAWHVRIPRLVMARRYSASGQMLGEYVIDDKPYAPYHVAYFPMVGFDGTNYTIVWQKRDIRVPNGHFYHTRIFARQLSPQGELSPGNRRRVGTRYPDAHAGVTDAALACDPTNGCMFTWRQFPYRFVAPMNGVRLDHRRKKTISLPSTAAINFEVRNMVRGPEGYLLVGVRRGACGVGGNISIGVAECDNYVRAGRLSLDGAVLDTEPIHVNVGTGPQIVWRGGPSAYFDGTNYLIAFSRPRSLADGGRDGGHVFMARVGADGTVLDDEQEGLLVTPVQTGGPTAVTVVGGKPLVIWTDSRNDQSNGHPFGSAYAQFLQP